MLTALSLSGVAIYYSVAGLVAIFAGAAIPIIIMGGILEISKLVSAVWLHRFWNEAPRWLRYYLLGAIIVLMLITSMGIFGFLSKAHIEQTGNNNEIKARLEQVNSEIARKESLIQISQESIDRLANEGSSSQISLQAQIDKEQARINETYQQLNDYIADQAVRKDVITSLFKSELIKIDTDLAMLKDYIDSDNIEKAQAYIGVKVDGKYGPQTAQAFQEYQAKKTEERNTWLQKIENAASNDEIKIINDDIARRKNLSDTAVEQSRTIIQKLQAELGGLSDTQSVSDMIAKEQNAIEQNREDLKTLITNKYEFESSVRQLEVEVGPVKYIAEMIYGDGTTFDLLEEAVRYVIIILIFVFDPLAVMMLVASQYSLRIINPAYTSIFDIGKNIKEEEYVEEPAPKVVQPKKKEPKPRTRSNTKVAKARQEERRDEKPQEKIEEAPPPPPAPKPKKVEVVKEKVVEVPKPTPKPEPKPEPPKPPVEMVQLPPRAENHPAINVQKAREWINVNRPQNKYPRSP